MAENRKFVDAALRVPCTPDTFVRTWFDLLKVRHNLTEREMDVAAKFVIYYDKLLQRVQDEDILNRHLFSKEMKNRIREECGLAPPRFRTILQHLRENGIISNDKLNPQYIPKYTPGVPFRLLFLIDDHGIS